MKKVSFVCTTYGRFTCVERIVAQYHAQTYPNKELIIFNTDEEHPYELGFEDDSIVIVNNNINYQTACEYENRGQICRDAVTHATGNYFMYSHSGCFTLTSSSFAYLQFRQIGQSGATLTFNLYGCIHRIA